MGQKYRRGHGYSSNRPLKPDETATQKGLEYRDALAELLFGAFQWRAADVENQESGAPVPADVWTTLRESIDRVHELYRRDHAGMGVITRNGVSAITETPDRDRVFVG